MAILIYRLLELLNGEKGLKIINYKLSQRLKFYLLTNWINYN
jgi:hypothetical protein